MGSKDNGPMKKTVKIKIAKINNNNNNNNNNKNDTKKTKAPQSPKTKTVITKTKTTETKTRETKINIKSTTKNTKNTTKTTPKTGGQSSRNSGKTTRKLSLPNLKPGVVFSQFKALKWNKWTRLIFVFLILLFFMQIVCTSTTNWVAFGSTQTHGLFRFCRENSVGSTSLDCYDFPHLADYQIQMQALMMVSIFMFLFCLIYLIMWMKGNNLPVIGLTILVEITALFIVVSASIFTDKHFCVVAKSKLGTFGWSYYLAWCTSLVAIVTGLMVTKIE